MKLVKNFLRLLPVIVLLVFFVSFALNFNQFHSELSGNINIHQILEQNLKDFLGSFYYWTDTIEDSDILYTLFIEPFGTYSNSLMISFINFTFSTLFYELMLSLVFLFFDVFNWFLSLGRNLLKKGGKYDD